VDGEDETPKTFEMKSKLDMEDLEEMFGHSPKVYLVNTNHHKMPRNLKGCLLWLEKEKVIGVILKSTETAATIRISHPLSQEGKLLVIDDILHTKGYFLQKEIMLDMSGCIKMRFEGPSVVQVPKEWRKLAKLPEDKPKDKLCNLKTDPLHRKRTLGHDLVDTIYIYRPDETKFTEADKLKLFCIPKGEPYNKSECISER
jgi:hypothetical protein